jgi:hypothetical protein
MELADYLRDPMWAGLIAALITAGYIHAKTRINNEGTLPNSAYVKPAVLVAILVYFIVANGVAQRETISNEPF